jgi:nitroreductase
MMDLFTAIENRASCRAFLEEPVSTDEINKILNAAVRAPSPLNLQPWQFVVISAKAKKQAIHEEAERCRKWAIEASGWTWLNKYRTDFLVQAPLLVAVIGDPKKSGMDIYQPDGGLGYVMACSAAVQNMLLASHALGLGSLFFTMFDKTNLSGILDIPEDKTPLALVCIGKPKEPSKPIPRKEPTAKTLFED